jgi:hypothetical protein
LIDCQSTFAGTESGFDRALEEESRRRRRKLREQSEKIRLGPPADQLAFLVKNLHMQLPKR